jgi:hypothetical protein
LSQADNEAHIRPETAVAPRFALGPVRFADVCLGIVGLLFVQYWAGDAVLIATSGSLDGIAKTFTTISVLPVVEWYALFGLIRGMTGPPVRAELAFGSLVIFVLGLTQLHHQRTAFLAEAILLFLLWARTPGLGRVSLIVLLIALQLGEGTPPLHGLFTWFDAQILPVVMDAIGQPVDRIGNLIRSPGLPDGLVLLAGCAGSNLMLPMAMGFLALVLTSHPKLSRIDWRWLGLVLAAAMVMNIVRLCLMLQSRADFESWHEGNGASLISVAGLIVTLAAWSATTRRDGAA